MTTVDAIGAIGAIDIVEDEDEDFFSGFAVVELHPDRSSLAGLDFTDRGEPVLPMLRVGCGQFSFKISPGRNEIHEHDVVFAERVAQSAVAFRDRLVALAITQSQARAATAATGQPTGDAS